MKESREDAKCLAQRSTIPRFMTRVGYSLVLLLFAHVISETYAAEKNAPQLTAPKIAELIKSSVYKKMMEDREVMVHARLEQAGTGKEPAKSYAFYTAMVVRADVEQVRRILTDYPLYAKVVPYVDRADYSPSTRILRLNGGIWKFRLDSQLRFEERGNRWLRYEIVGGHLIGLSGDILFESLGEKGTAVYFGGSLAGTDWPPTLVMERGAEIVFGLTGNRMRSYIEAQKRAVKGDDAHDSKIPQHRSRLE